MKITTLFSALLLLSLVLQAAPTPIPPPEMSHEEACKLVLLKDKNPYDSNWEKTFPREMIYTTMTRSESLQMFVHRESERNKAKGKEWEDLLSEWGWLITVVKGNDLSQTATYFVQPVGKVHLLWATE